MRAEIAVEQGTTKKWYGRCIEVPGTIAWAKGKEELLKELERELDYHMTWLRQHGERVPTFDDVSLTIVEEVHNVAELGKSGGEVALFHYDRNPVTPEDMQYFFRLMANNRKDLLTITRNLSENQLAIKPQEKLRTITDILHHICNAEEFYISRLGPEADILYETYTGLPIATVDTLPLFQRLQVVRNACCKTLKDTIPEKGNTIFTREEYTDYPDEKWTAHKVMRRFLEHEREHIYNIQEYLGEPPRTLL
jgi:predicted RNase H-like HicB family nuclease